MSYGIRIRHKTKRGGIALVPIWKKPIRGLQRSCPTCQVIHTDSFGRHGKTVHLYLDSAGTCIVSPGVLEELKSIGMPNLVVDAAIAKPPPLTLSRNRFEVDQHNATIRSWKEPAIV